jgi:hypothetical protein
VSDDPHSPDQFSYLHQPTIGRITQAARDAEHAPAFREKIDAARRLARGRSRAGYARTTGPLSQYNWAELLERLADNEARARVRPTSRKYGRLRPQRPQGLSHLDRYLRRVRAIAHHHLLSESAAPYVHECVRGRGYRVELPAELEQPPARTGPIASAIAAHVTRTPWGSGTAANAAAYSRNRPPGGTTLADQYTQAYEGALAALRAQARPPEKPACPNCPGTVTRRTRLDGSLEWFCPSCHHSWPVFPPASPDHPTGPAA